MATTKAAKTATTTSSGGTKAKGKRSGGEGKSTPMASHFPMPTGAFTVEVPVDPGVDFFNTAPGVMAQLAPGESS